MILKPTRKAGANRHNIITVSEIQNVQLDLFFVGNKQFD
jgi:hypothetical protein